jgi:hypothetical protein
MHGAAQIATGLPTWREVASRRLSWGFGPAFHFSRGIHYFFYVSDISSNIYLIYK